MYSMKLVTQKTGLSAPTLRYYEKEKLLPYVKRDKNGLRLYSDRDIKSILFIKALRSTDMPVREIKEYVRLYEDGDQSFQLRRDLLENHKTRVEENISLQINYLKKIKEKLALYDQSAPELKR
ncbi:MerR family transcriptional regulator [Jeotgalibacillus sp. JSM ZJ347]|uniref:MerR family transcriptional regulator n=1 Tax=Jeotgalibacillus sp. JSM ZJ347 TaxID=3342117 RepID=UPI0035A9AB5C